MVTQKIHSLWQEITNNPDSWLSELPGSLVFVAGGGLPLVFGNKDSQIWQAFSRVLEDNSENIEVAGVSFSRNNFLLLGNFYRFLKGYDCLFHCIDERLESSLEDISEEVHEHCGACAASQAVISDYLVDKEMTVEDILLKELGEENLGKQAIYSSMPDHTSLVIFIDFDANKAVIAEEKRTILRENRALAFQVSFPIEKVAEFIETSGLDNDQKNNLLEALVKWNVQIARNIIGGDHNQLKDFADETLFVINQKVSSENESLFNEFLRNIKTVANEEKLININYS